MKLEQKIVVVDSRVPHNTPSIYSYIDKGWSIVLITPVPMGTYTEIHYVIERIEKEEYNINTAYAEWCKETKRNGAVLVGSSMKDFFTWLEKTYELSITKKTY